MSSCLIFNGWNTVLSRSSFSRVVLDQGGSPVLKTRRYFGTVTKTEAQNVGGGALQGIRVLDLSRVLAVRSLMGDI